MWGSSIGLRRSVIDVIGERNCTKTNNFAKVFVVLLQSFTGNTRYGIINA